MKSSMANAQSMAIGTVFYSLSAAFLAPPSVEAQTFPTITSVSTVFPAELQTITIAGSGFGTMSPYVGDSPDIEIQDVTAGWNAGFSGKGGSDTVMLSVSSWTETEIVLQGFTGDYGQNGFVLNAMDQVVVSAVGAQTGLGPASCSIIVGAGPSACAAPAITSVSAILPQQTQVITIGGSGFGTMPAFDGDSPDIRIHDLNGGWSAGFTGDDPADTVTLSVSSWTDTEIVIQGMTGAYGQDGFVLDDMDQVIVSVSGARSGVGPTNCAITVGGGPSACSTVLFSSLLPSSRSVEVGEVATVFSTMINASSGTTGDDCTVQPTTSVPASFTFQATNPSTNGLVGAPDAPVSIAPGAAQSFLLALTPSAAFTPTNVAFSFACANAPEAASDVGLNTLLLSASTTPTPDIVALSATASNNGIVDIPGANGSGAFVVATVNLGSQSQITASANIGGANLPVAVSICETVPATSACMTVPAPTVTLSIDADATPTFAIFVEGGGTVPFQPAANRVFVQFADPTGAIRSSTSVAVQTQ